MTTTRLEALQTLLQAIRDYLKLNDQWRAAWRYADRRARIAEPRRQAYNLVEIRRNQLHQLLNDNTDDPTYLDRQARALIEKWDHRNQQFEIYRAEGHRQNLQHLDTAEKTLKDRCSAIIEIINKTT